MRGGEVLNHRQRLEKRVLDLVLAGMLLVMLMPFLALVALSILLDAGRPVLLRQKRVGENGRLFGMLKFRTMVRNAGELRGLVEIPDADGQLRHKSKSDPRITRGGRLLRRFSIDELPQLVNVLRGEMSLVGPRPELPLLVEGYQPWQHQRLQVPQGVTGWWQINGRSERVMHLHTEDDLYYIDHYSIWLDLRILLQTPGAVLRGPGAY